MNFATYFADVLHRLTWTGTWGVEENFSTTLRPKAGGSSEGGFGGFPLLRRPAPPNFAGALGEAS